MNSQIYSNQKLKNAVKTTLTGLALIAQLGCTAVSSRKIEVDGKKWEYSTFMHGNSIYALDLTIPGNDGSRITCSWEKIDPQTGELVLIGDQMKLTSATKAYSDGTKTSYGSIEGYDNEIGKVKGFCLSKLNVLRDRRVDFSVYEASTTSPTPAIKGLSPSN